MLSQRWLKRIIVPGLLILFPWIVTACYKDAGENVQPTSNRVYLNEITPTTPAPAATPTILVSPAASSTQALVPTTTPFGAAAEDTSSPQQTPQVTGSPVTAAPTEPAIVTPGMGDVPASPTLSPTVNPALMPTPTSIPVEENPCIHVVQSGDTLYSIAQEYEVLLPDLVAANPSLLGGSAATPLQIGWELQLPGCETGAGEPAGDVTPEVTSAAAETTGPGTTPTTHTVQPGETIYAIARHYGLDPQAIIEANPQVNPSLIHPGDVLNIPAAP